jgi:hypothetical protein
MHTTPNLEKILPIQVQKASSTPNSLDESRTSPWHIITTNTGNCERILKEVREKKQTTYKGKHSKIIADFQAEILEARRAWREVFPTLNENNFNPKDTLPRKLSLKIDGAIINTN